jgi:hypothetical protein
MFPWRNGTLSLEKTKTTAKTSQVSCKGEEEPCRHTFEELDIDDVAVL